MFHGRKDRLACLPIISNWGPEDSAGELQTSSGFNIERPDPFWAGYRNRLGKMRAVLSRPLARANRASLMHRGEKHRGASEIFRSFTSKSP